MQSKSFAIRDSFKNLMITLGRRIVFFKLTKFVSKWGATTRAKVDELDGIPKERAPKTEHCIHTSVTGGS